MCVELNTSGVFALLFALCFKFANNFKAITECARILNVYLYKFDVILTVHRR